MDLKYKNIKVCSWAKKLQTGCNASADIIVPDTKPDIYRVLCVNAVADLEERYIRKDKIIYSGSVKFNILYTGENERDVIYTIEHTAPFNHQAELNGSSEDALCISKCVVASTDYNVKNSRKISALANILLDTDAVKYENIEFLEEVEGEDCLPHKTSSISADTSVSAKEVEFTLSDTISIPLTDEGEIFDFSVRLDSLETKTVNNKAILKGILPAKIFFNSQNQLSTYETELGFTEIVDLDMATVDSSLCSYFNIAGSDYSINDSDGEKTMDVDIKIKGYIRVFEKLECPLVSDIYSPDYTCNVSRRETRVENYHTPGDTALTLKETLSVVNSDETISRVHYMSVYPSCKKVISEKSSIKVSGDASVCVIYSDSEDNLNSIKKDIPFETEFPCRNDSGTAAYDVSVTAQNYSYVLSSSSEIQTRIVLKVSAGEIDYLPLNIVSSLSEDKSSPIDKSSQASITVCYPTEDKTLWDYAVKYNTTVDEIAYVNNIDADAPLCPGKALLIPKRRVCVN